MESTSVLLSKKDREREIEELDVHEIFITNLYQALGAMSDKGFHVVLGMDANDDVRDGSVSVALTDIGITVAVINNHKG